MLAHSDGVNPYPIHLCELGGVERGNLPRIVHTVGEQYDHAALGLRSRKPGNRRSQTPPYCRSVGDQIGLDILHKVDKRRPVGGQGALGEAFAREHHYPDPVGYSLGDELHGYILCGGDTVGLEVPGQHTGRDVHRQHYVDSLGIHPFGFGR